MKLAPGDRFGPYQIIDLVGVGGMGEVYRARDTRLHRDVALKVLPDARSLDEESLQRFEREARLLASLNHPNIATLHGLETSDGVHALVMELVDGERLDDRLTRSGRHKGLPLADALQIARQVAEALDAAHERGVVHRDLKPANIQVRSDGTVKVLDFGIAKVFDTSGHHGPAVEVTQMRGAIVGTHGYMSPEQATGTAVDRRTDIWAFGCVLYELLTGQRAFEGDTDSAILARVLERAPDWSKLPADLPARIRILLQRCLEKDPRKRQRDSGDVRLDLEQALAELATPAARVRADRTGRSWLVASIVAAIVAVVVIVPLYRRDRPAAETRPQQFVLLPPQGTAFGAGVVDRVPSFAVSPDGTQLAFVASEASGASAIWLRSLDDLDAARLNGTEGGTNPFWSPDSRYVAFFADGKLKKVAVASGSPVTLAETPGAGAGGTWNGDGVIVFAPGPQSALLRVSDTGGAPTPITELSSGDLGHSRPQFLPDGRHFLFFAVAAPPRRGIYIGDLESPAVQPLLATREMARYAPSGHLLFLQEGRLVAQAFDANRLALSGDPTPIAESVAFVTPDGRAAFDVSETGTLIYRVSGIQAATQPHWVDRSGNSIGTVGDPGDYQTASLSPDGSRLAVEMHDLRSGTGDLWIIDVVRGSTSRLTFDGMHDNTAVWSPDGNEIVFTGRPNGGRNLHRRAVGEGQSEDVLLAPGPERIPTDWSRDGHYILYDAGPAGQRDLWALQMPDREAVPLLQSSFNENGGHVSGDGQWVAYVSDETGRKEVYVRSFPAMTNQRIISNNGGIAPRWSRDGTEIFYVGLDDTVYAVPVVLGGRFESGTPRLLFATDMRGSPVAGGGQTADDWFAVDQQRFLIIPTPTGPSPPAPPLTVVRDWVSALTRNAR